MLLETLFEELTWYLKILKWYERIDHKGNLIAQRMQLDFNYYILRNILPPKFRYGFSHMSQAFQWWANVQIHPRSKGVNYILVETTGQRYLINEVFYNILLDREGNIEPVEPN